MKSLKLKRKGKVPRQGKPHRGLCATCNNADTCTFPKKLERPVLNCDEFEGYPVIPVITSFKSTSPKIRAQRVFTTDSLAKYKGLCKNCDNRKSCTFPKPECGVWHCEEYR